MTSLKTILYLILDSDVSILVEQQLHERLVTIDDSHHQDSLTILVTVIAVSVAPQQQVGHVPISAHCSCITTPKYCLIKDNSETWNQCQGHGENIRMHSTEGVLSALA